MELVGVYFPVFIYTGQTDRNARQICRLVCVTGLKTHDPLKAARSKFPFLCANGSVLSIERISPFKGRPAVLVGHRQTSRGVGAPFITPRCPKVYAMQMAAALRAEWTMGRDSSRTHQLAGHPFPAGCILSQVHFSKGALWYETGPGVLVGQFPRKQQHIHVDLVAAIFHDHVLLPGRVRHLGKRSHKALKRSPQ